MKIDLEKLSNLERRLKVEIPVDKVLEAFDVVYKKIQGQVTLKGFRKGKAPLATIKSLYQDHAKQDVVEKLVQKHYVEALETNNLDPVSYPSIKIESLTEGEPFRFSAEFEVRPDVVLEQYEKLPVEKEKLELDPKHVDTVVENIRKSRGQLVPVFEDRPAQNGDFAVIDFDGRIDGKSVENAKGNEHTLELGSNEFIPGFEEGVLGMKVGTEKNLNLKFPAEYHAPQLAGKDIEFHVKLKALKKRELAEINEAFVKEVGFESVDKMRETIQQDYERTETKRVDEDFKNRLLKILVSRNPVDVPKSMLEEQKQLLLEDVKKRMLGQGMTNKDFEEYAQKWDDDFKKTATFIIQSSFLVNAIADKENLRASEDDVKAKIEEYSKQTGIDFSRLTEYYGNPDQKSRLRFKITEEKVLGRLASSANVREVPKSEIKER